MGQPHSAFTDRGGSLLEMGLPHMVVNTLQGAGALSTRASYSYLWRLFELCCKAKQVDPLICGSQVIMLYLQEHIDRGRLYCSIKCMIAVIKAACVERCKISENCGIFTAYFPKAARRHACHIGY